MRFLWTWLTGKTGKPSPDATAPARPNAPSMRPPHLRRLDVEEFQYTEGVCEAYLLSGDTSIATLMAARALLAERYPDHLILCSLDDLDQAVYTSGHALESHGLVRDSDPYNEPENRGNRTGNDTKGFELRLKRFRAAMPTASLADIEGVLPNFARDEDFTIVDANRTPDAILDDQITLHIVPVKQPEELIAAFPNGYFLFDLNPFELALMARHLNSQFDLELFGLGSSYIGFLSPAPLNETMSARAAKRISELFQTRYQDEVESFLYQHLQRSRFVFLAYVETSRDHKRSYNS